MPSKRQDPDEIVDIKKPRYAVAALETLYRGCYEVEWQTIPDEKLWHFAKFPEVWADSVLKRKPTPWTYKRCESVVRRVRQLYVWASPILEN